MNVDTGKPTPVRDGDSTPYWEAADRGELQIQQCASCHAYVFYPRSICPHCFRDDLTWITASGRGHIYSYTVVHRAFGPFAEETPYVVAIVELEEGVRMLSRVVGPPEQVAIDLPVQVTFERVSAEVTLPYFERIDAGASAIADTRRGANAGAQTDAGAVTTGTAADGRAILEGSQ